MYTHHVCTCFTEQENCRSAFQFLSPINHTKLVIKETFLNYHEIDVKNVSPGEKIEKKNKALCSRQYWMMTRKNASC